MAGSLLVAAGLILILGVMSQWIAYRLRLPAILVLLTAGFLAGPIFQVIDVDALLGDLLEPIVGLSVAVILFEGGLSLRFSEIRAHGKAVFRLVSLGVVVTAVVGAVAAHRFLSLPWDLAFLLGTALSVTGPTVVLPLLRHVQPTRHVEAVLRWEGILIDPVGAILAVLTFEAILAGGGGVGVWLTGLAWAVAAGAFFGLAIGWALVELERRYWIPDHLQSAMGLAAVVAAYVASDLFQVESGLIAVTAMGIMMANQKRASVRHLLHFKEDLSQILLGILFIVLAARLPRSAVGEIGIGAVLFLAALILVARPVGVALSTIGSRLNTRERTFLAWMAPRGIVAAAVSAFFALRLEEHGRSEAAVFVPITFFVIVGTVVLYGLTARPVARLLKVAGPPANGVLIMGASVAGRELARIVQESGRRALVADTNAEAVTAAKLQGLEAVRADPLALSFAEDHDLAGIGSLWALTPNRENNALAAVRFSDLFGRARVFQIPVLPPEDDNVEQDFRGRFLFGRSMTYARLRDRLSSGWSMRRTPITDEFSMEDHAAIHRQRVPLFVLRHDGGIRTFSDDSTPEPHPGDILVALVKDRTDEEE